MLTEFTKLSSWKHSLMLLIDHYTFKKSFCALQEPCWIRKHCLLSQRNPCSLEGKRVEITFICLDFCPSDGCKGLPTVVCLGLRCICWFPMVKGSSSVSLKVMSPGDRRPQTESQLHLCPALFRSQVFSIQWTWFCSSSAQFTPVFLSLLACDTVCMEFRPRWLNSHLSQVS